jgi:hypothetical protein
MRKLFIGIATAAIAVSLAPSAHADPNSYYLQCLNNKGLQITDVSKAVHLGVLIQNDEEAQMPADTLIYNLETKWYQTPELAYAEMNCAAMTLMHGNGE